MNMKLQQHPKLSILTNIQKGTIFPSSGEVVKNTNIFNGLPRKHLCQEVFKNNLKKWIKEYLQLLKSYSEYNQGMLFQVLIGFELLKERLLLVHIPHFYPLQYL